MQNRNKRYRDSRFSFGGGERARTDDLLLAKQALSQLSYTPIFIFDLVGLGRVELPTSRLSGVRSNQLSYRPVEGFLFENGIVRQAQKIDLGVVRRHEHA